MESETYKGYEIEIIHDEFPENPFEAWDCEPPLAVAYDRNITSYAKQYGDVNDVPTLTREQIKANLPAILSMLDLSTVWAIRNAMPSSYHPYDIVCCVNDAISEYVNDLSNDDRLEALCDLYNMAGIPALCKSSRGYSQGDYALVLAVATPEFQKACGNGEGYWDDPQHLQAAIDLWGNWAWGNVYGYNIEGIDDASCSGYYGDPETSGLLDDAKSSIDYHIERERSERLKTVKTWIKNHVPLTHRTFA